MKIRVLLADDHELVRHGLSRMLEDETDIDVIAQASRGEEAVKLCESERPNVVLMDVRMPGMGGLEATRQITRSFPEIRVVAVTACNEEPFPSKLIKAGAAGFVSKGCDISEIISAIRNVMCGKHFISADIARQMALKPLQSNSESPFDLLSDRELQICIMVINCEKAQSIASALDISAKTVNSYRYRIFEKLDIASDVELTRLAIRYGMLDAGDC